METTEKDDFGMPCDFAATPGVRSSQYCLRDQCIYATPLGERFCPHGRDCDREGHCLHPELEKP